MIAHQRATIATVLGVWQDIVLIKLIEKKAELRAKKTNLKLKKRKIHNKGSIEAERIPYFYDNKESRFGN